MSKKILIVDEDKRFLEKSQKMFDKYGFDVLACESLKEAEEISERNVPDIAIIDLLKHNDDSGFVLSYRLRKKFLDLPIIIISSVSARSGVFFTEEGREWIHADTILEKDTSSEQLLKEVFKLLKI